MPCVSEGKRARSSCERHHTHDVEKLDVQAAYETHTNPVSCNLAVVAGVCGSTQRHSSCDAATANPFARPRIHVDGCSWLRRPGSDRADGGRLPHKPPPYSVHAQALQHAAYAAGCLKRHGVCERDLRDRCLLRVCSIWATGEKSTFPPPPALLALERAAVALSSKGKGEQRECST